MKYTNEVFQRLSRGQFICSNSIDESTRAIYNDIDENMQDYADYFGQIDFHLESGDGYFYFIRKEQKIITENKLLGLAPWIDYLDFLKAYDTSFDAGTQFNLAQIEILLSSNIELRDKLEKLFTDKSSNREKIEMLVKVMTDMGLTEQVNEVEGMYQVTTAFHYIEHLIDCIHINEEIKDEVPE